MSDVVAAMGLFEITDRMWYAQGTCAVQGNGIRACMEWLEAAVSGRVPPPHLTGISSVNRVEHVAAVPISLVWSSSATDAIDFNSAEDWAITQAELRSKLERRNQAFEGWIAREDAPLDSFLAAVERCDLEPWDHYAHVRLAWAAVVLHGVEAGFARLEGRIARFIARSPRTRGRAFHATMTRFWAHMIAHLVIEQHREHVSDPRDFKAFLSHHYHHRVRPSNDPCFLDLTSPAMHRPYYSSAAMFSDAARRSPAQPDLAPLPELLPEYRDVRDPPRSGPYCGHGHWCAAGADCAAADGVVCPAAFEADRAFVRRADYHRQR